MAQHHLDLVWNGFARTQDFIDCLCRALTCWTKASDATSVLTGCKAVMDCQKAARQAYCDDEDEPSDDDSGDDGNSDDEDDDAPCGCDHGHEYRRRHHRHGHRHD